ncbi:unnamed protein product, partial [Iphiclides podalirius]
MFNGIKPTRLWHLTSRKFLNKMTQERQEYFKQSWKQLEQPYFLQFVGIHLGAVAGVLYSLGWFEKPVCPARLKKEEGEMEEAAADQACDPEKVLKKCSQLDKEERPCKK